MNDRPIWVTVLVGVLWIIAALVPIYFHYLLGEALPRSHNSQPVDFDKIFPPQTQATSEPATRP